MRVKCINNYDDWNETQNENITIGRVYDVVAFSPIEFRIIGNNGSQQIFVCDVYNNKFFEIIKEDEVRKEETRVIRKLEDLDGLENGSGLRFVIKRECHEDDIYNFLILTTEKKEFQSWDLTDGKALETYSDFFKAMGFKFEYKPLRTEQEVLEEIKNLEGLNYIPFEENFCVEFDYSKQSYGVVKYGRYHAVGIIFMTKEQAQKYADELNEIIGKVK